MKQLLCFVLGIFVLSAGITQSIDSIKLLHSKAPKTFSAVFQTSKGEFIIESNSSWAPEGADRFYHLVSSGFYNNTRIFRSTDNYVQFGINNDTALNAFWDRHPLKDEKLKFNNTGGTVAFGSGGPDTRATQIFVNKIDNPFLDTLGNSRSFPPFGKIISGMEVVKAFYSGYGDEITYHHQDSIYLKGNTYLSDNFPLIDVIFKAYIR